MTINKSSISEIDGFKLQIIAGGVQNGRVEHSLGVWTGLIASVVTVGGLGVAISNVVFTRQNKLTDQEIANTNADAARYRTCKASQQNATTPNNWCSCACG